MTACLCRSKVSFFEFVFSFQQLDPPDGTEVVKLGANTYTSSHLGAPVLVVFILNFICMSAVYMFTHIYL